MNDFETVGIFEVAQIISFYLSQSQTRDYKIHLFKDRQWHFIYQGNTNCVSLISEAA